MKQKTLLKKIDNINLNSLKEKYFIDELFLIEKDYIILIIKLNEINKLMEDNSKTFDNLTSSVSIYLEEYLQDDFRRWNVYLIYIIEESITKEIKYKIENDTFFARKIVEDNYSSELSDENIEKLISEHIDLTDLSIKSIQPKKESYESKSEIYSKLKNVNKLTETKIDEILKFLEKDEDEI